MSVPIFKHHLQKISRSELNEAVVSYRKGLDKNETTSCLIGLEDIQRMIAHYSNLDKYPGLYDKIGAFRIYFFREDKNRKYDMGKDLIQTLESDETKTQMSIIIVPVNHYLTSRSGDDMFDEDKCWVLTPGGENTGLCPKNCPH
jgi:hypothetical protein